jgi:hypothetical protein
MSDVERLLEELRGHPEADRLLRECGQSDYAEAVLTVARQLGIETSADAAEVRAYVRDAEASRRASTDRVADEVAELDDDDLEAVVGGDGVKLGSDAPMSLKSRIDFFPHPPLAGEGS